MLFGSLEKILQVDPVLHRIGPLIMNTICYSLSVHTWSAILAQIHTGRTFVEFATAFVFGVCFCTEKRVRTNCIQVYKRAGGAVYKI